LPNSLPGSVLRAVRERRIDAITSWELAEEISEVLRRPKLRRYGLTKADIDEVVGLLAPFLPTVEFEGLIRDPDDRAVVNAALSAEADAIVTGDRDLLDDDDLHRRLASRGVRVLTPKELLAEIGGL
jgi:putative PIN family toxin of toxin-antitoxin system